MDAYGKYVVAHVADGVERQDGDLIIDTGLVTGKHAVAVVHSVGSDVEGLRPGVSISYAVAASTTVEVDGIDYLVIDSNGIFGSF